MRATAAERHGATDLLFRVVGRRFHREKYLYLMFFPVLLYYVVFQYIPMYGVTIAFKDFSPSRGILGSPWIGFVHFREFFSGPYFFRLIRNTLLLNVYTLVYGFPAPIVLALLLNEVRNRRFRRTVQTVSYLPHFISLVVVVGFILEFTRTNGLINDIIAALGGGRIRFMAEPRWFRTLYVSSQIWQEIGWGSIIYLAALTGIDPQLYEAAMVDGAGRWRQMLRITLPGISPTIIIMLILRMGRMMQVGFEKIILMYNPLIYDTADVISTFVYRKGLLEYNYSYSTAVDLFNTVINLVLLLTVNRISRKVSETSLW